MLTKYIKKLFSEESKPRKLTYEDVDQFQNELRNKIYKRMMERDRIANKSAPSMEKTN